MKYFKSLRKYSFIIVLFLTNPLFGQNTPKTKSDIANSLKSSIGFLADDKLEGRLVGSHGERLAYEYLISYFKSLGLEPAGDQGYLQAFTLTRLSYKFADISIKSGKYTLEMQGPAPDKMFPLSMSGCGQVKAKAIWMGYGIHDPAEGFDDYQNIKNGKGKVFVMKIGFPKPPHPHSALPDVGSIEQKIDTAIAYGAKAVVFVNYDNEKKEPEFKPFFKNQLKAIPVYFLNAQHAIDSTLWDKASISILVDTMTRTIEGHNVIAKIWNKSEQTVVVGAHYDHLGYNELGGSTWRPESNEKAQIHNGADDNASGTGALLELAEMIKSKSEFQSKNYVFIAFSGEEEGLLGSNYFCKHPTVDLSKVSYMINMDMLGRLDTAKAAFAISGTGTSPSWKKALEAIPTDGLKLKFTESGTGSSDHTSFYYSQIPALHFFTGTHADYHKPSDDSEKINYEGEAQVISYIYQLIWNMRDEAKFAFTKTKEDSSTSTKASFKVTLGIMPDYLYEGKGLKMDGVTEGKPASVAGLKKGDILIKLGEDEITDMQSYIKALSKHNKGDEAEVRVMRNGVEMPFQVRF